MQREEGGAACHDCNSSQCLTFVKLFCQKLNKGRRCRPWTNRAVAPVIPVLPPPLMWKRADLRRDRHTRPSNYCRRPGAHATQILPSRRAMRTRPGTRLYLKGKFAWQRRHLGTEPAGLGCFRRHLLPFPQAAHRAGFEVCSCLVQCNCLVGKFRNWRKLQKGGNMSLKSAADIAPKNL
ncbi:hypothetical protein CSE45_0867 [Citreicella sp. SE45]|nr:hypothetical protein CSE45_0867 [Citreicella sp. SE45]